MQENKTEETAAKSCPCRKCCKYLWNMKRRYKILWLLILLLIGGVWAAMSTDWQSLVRSLVRKYGTQAVGTSVNIGKINLSLLDGKGGVSNITVANPKGYSSDHIIELGNVSVNVDTKSLTEKTIVINEIRVDAPKITYEILDLRHNNVKDILQNLQKSSAPAQKSETKGGKKDEGAARQVAIRKLVIADGAVLVVSNMLGSSQSLSVPLPTVTIKNIGSENQGVTIEEGLSRVFRELLNNTINIVSAVDLSKVIGSVGDVAQNTVAEASQAAETAFKGVGDTVKGVGDGVKGLADGVGGLF